MPLTTPGSVTFALVDAAGNAIVDVTPTVPVGHAVVVDAFGNATVTGPPGEGYVLTVGARTVPYVIPAAASEVEAIQTTADAAAASAAANVSALAGKVNTSAIGAANGVAGLDVDGKVPAGQLPAAGSVPDATASVKGVVQLAGDLAGTAAAPTVPGLSGKAALDLSNVTASVGRTALGLGTAATANTGTGATNAILGNDARLADERVPTDGSVSTAKVVDGAVTLPKTSAGVQASLAAADAAAPKVRTVTVAYAATVTPNADSTDVLNVGALTGPLTLATPTGTPRDGQTLRVRFEQDATGGRVVTFGAGYAFGTDITTALLPTAGLGKWVQLFAYDATTVKWRALAIARGF